MYGRALFGDFHSTLKLFIGVPVAMYGTDFGQILRLYADRYRYLCSVNLLCRGLPLYAV